MCGVVVACFFPYFQFCFACFRYNYFVMSVCNVVVVVICIHHSWPIWAAWYTKNQPTHTHRTTKNGLRKKSTCCYDKRLAQRTNHPDHRHINKIEQDLSITLLRFINQHLFILIFFHIHFHGRKKTQKQNSIFVFFSIQNH